MTAPLSKRLRIGLLSPHNAYNRMAFSGSIFYARRALEQQPGVDLRVLGNHRPPQFWDRLRNRLMNPPPFALHPDELAGLDGIVAMLAVPQVVALPPVPCPVLFVTDATPAYLRETYGYARPPDEVAMETTAIARSTRVVYTSDFMAALAVEEFGPALRRPPTVAAFGINLDHLPDAAPEKSPMDPLRLLFLGMDWDRKGGDIAVAAARRLAERGIPVRLTCGGAVPDHLRGDPLVEDLGYLDKNRAAHARRLDSALTEAHLLILPSRADCTPMVVAEANAHGTPAVTSDVGGLPTLVRPGENGALVPAGAPPEVYADTIAGLVADPAAYAALSQRSHQTARDRLCWSAWAKRMVDLIRTEQGPPAA